MQLEEYFQFLSPDDIRIKGHRIGIESILYEYIHRGQTAEQIAQRFPTLSLEQVYAAILYYLHNKEQGQRIRDRVAGRQPTQTPGAARASQPCNRADSQDQGRARGCTAGPRVSLSYLAAGRHVPGIFMLNPDMSIGETTDELVLLSLASSEEEYRDTIVYMPIT